MNQPYQHQWSNESRGPIGSVPETDGFFGGYQLAPFPIRAVAGLVDYGLFLGIPIAFLPNSLGWFVALVLTFANSGFLAAKTSQSLGKRLCGIRMVRINALPDGTADVVFVPIWVGFIRVVFHVIDTWSFFIGWAAPLFNKSRGTFADYLTRCVHFSDPRLPIPRPSRGGLPDWPDGKERYPRR